MNSLWKQEFKKIERKRSTKIACCILLLLMVIAPFLNRNELRWYQSSDQKPWMGKVALNHMKQGAKSTEGVLDEDYLTIFLEQMQNEVNGKDGQGNDVSAGIVLNEKMMKYENLMRLIGIPFSGSTMYSGYVDIFAQLQSEDALSFYQKWKEYVAIQQATRGYEEESVREYLDENVQPFSYGYALGWSFAVSNYMDILLFISTVLIVTLASSFAFEHRSGVDALIISSKLGKRNIVADKMKASLLFATQLYVLSIVVFYASTFFVFGVQGGLTSLQASYPFSPIQWNMITINVVLCLLGLCGVWMMSMFILFVSQVMKSTYKAQATTFILLYLTYTMLVMDIGGILGKVLSMSPLGIVREDFVRDFARIKVGDIFLYQPLIYAVVMLLIMCGLAMIIHHSFKKQETR